MALAYPLIRVDGFDLDPDVIYAALDLGPTKARIRVLAPSVAA